MKELEKFMNPHNSTESPHNSTESPHISTESPHISTVLNKLEKMNICQYCMKKFSRIDSLKRHIEKNCKIKKNKKENLLCIVEEKNKEIEKLKIQKLDFINTNNILVNNTTNIHINNYGNENLEMLTDSFIKKLITLPYGAIPRLIQKIHFNKKYPENNNIRMKNKKDNKLQIYKKKDWKYVIKSETIETLLQDKSYQLDKFYEENKEEFKKIYQDRYDKYINKFNNEDKELLMSLRKETELLFWNNM